MRHNFQSTRAFVAGKLLPRAWRARGVHQEWWQYRRWHSTSTQNGAEKHAHARKTRQWFARAIRRELEESE